MTDRGTFTSTAPSASSSPSSSVRRACTLRTARSTRRPGRDLYACKVIPARGAWLEFEVDKRDLVAVRVDRKRSSRSASSTARSRRSSTTRRRVATCSLPTRSSRPLVDDQEILDFFGGAESIALTLEKDNTRPHAGPGARGHLPQAPSGRAAEHRAVRAAAARHVLRVEEVRSRPRRSVQDLRPRRRTAPAASSSTASSPMSFAALAKAFRAMGLADRSRRQPKSSPSRTAWDDELPRQAARG